MLKLYFPLDEKLETGSQLTELAASVFFFFLVELFQKRQLAKPSPGVSAGLQGFHLQGG